MTMNDNELLSALIDGELDGAELDKALGLIDEDNSSKEQLQRFQRSSDLLRGYSLNQNVIDISAKISDALNDEPAYEKEAVELSDNVIPIDTKANTGFLPDWFWQQAMGLAIAASIGALAVVGVWQQSEPNITSFPLAVVGTEVNASNTISVAHSVDKRQAELPAASNRWTVGEPEIADRLNTYLVDHNEYAGTSDVFSNARVIAYEAE